MASIIFGSFPGRIQTVSIEEGATIQSVSQELDFKLHPDHAIFVSGAKVGIDHPLSDGDIVLSTAPVRGEVTARVNGNIWRKHQSDADNVFPSELHAHNVEAPEVVNLWDGSVYDEKTRQLIRQMRKKELLAVRKKLRVELVEDSA